MFAEFLLDGITARDMGLMAKVGVGVLGTMGEVTVYYMGVGAMFGRVW